MKQHGTGGATHGQAGEDTGTGQVWREKQAGKTRKNTKDKTNQKVDPWVK